MHANNVAYARHVALEDTYPQLVRIMGRQEFRAVANVFLEQEKVLDRSLDRLGHGFANLLPTAGLRDLARVEWAWLEAFQAADEEALDLGALAAMSPHALALRTIGLHPAARLVPLESASEFEWEGRSLGRDDHYLVTRPAREVEVRAIVDPAAEIFLRAKDRSLGPGLLEEHVPAVIALIEAGAIILEPLP